MSESSPNRLLALDVVRGVAMLAMLISHSSWWITELDYRVAFGWDNLIIPALEGPQSWVGYVIQLASPTFFLLGGFSLALFVSSRQRRDWSEWQITRFLLVRGVVLVALDLTVMNLDFYEPYYHERLSVLTGMGLCVIALAFLRRLPLWALVGLMLAVLLGTQGYYYFNDWPRDPSLLRGALLAPSLADTWYVQFPALPWLPVMLLGYISGAKLMRGEIELSRYSFRLGSGLVAAGIVVVAANSFGNLYTDSRLILGKHPPDLAYLLLYVGFAFWLIALHDRFGVLNTNAVARALVILGQSALFFYIIHVRLIELMSPAIVQMNLPPLGQSSVIVLVTLPLLLLLCDWYRDYKRQHPASVLRYL